MTPPSHLSLRELACQDGSGYPARWRLDRLPKLRRAFETIRALWDKPIVVTSGYRSPAWNKQIGGAAHSQHCEGLALDLLPPEGVPVQDFWVAILQVADKAGLGGVGYAAPSQGGFVHVDCRARVNGQLAQWRYPVRNV